MHKTRLLGPAKPALDRRWTSPYSPSTLIISQILNTGGLFRGATRTGGGRSTRWASASGSPAAPAHDRPDLAEQTGFSPSTSVRWSGDPVAVAHRALQGGGGRWTSPSRVLSDVPHHGGGRTARCPGPGAHRHTRARHQHRGENPLSHGGRRTRLRDDLWSPAPPGAVHGDADFTHAGEEAAFVLEGTLELRLEKEQHVLHAGDSIHFPARFATTGAMAAPASSDHCGGEPPQFTTGKEGCGVNARIAMGRGCSVNHGWQVRVVRGVDSCLQRGETNMATRMS